MDTKEAYLANDTEAGIEALNVVKSVTAAQTAQVVAATEILAEAKQANPADADEMLRRLQVMLDGASPDDKAALEAAVAHWQNPPKTMINKDDELVDNWRSAVYPYKNRMSRKNYEKEKFRLQVELLKLQMWVRESGQRVVILFEGRDAAGKGGTIKRFMEHINPRGARVVALEKPTEAERGQWYFQRYVQHLPTSGEIVLFDRSWYNRSGVERVMGFFEERKLHPLKQWKLSPIDLASLDKWDSYTTAKEAMFFHTDTAEAPWTVVKSDCKKRARLNAMRYVLHRLHYTGKNLRNIQSIDPLIVGRANIMADL